MTPVSTHPAAWLREFFAARSLENPDGRPLYAYRCTAREFVSLKETLSAHYPYVSGSQEATIRAFVIYASEWWQRRYDGGVWAWEPLLASIRWHQVHYAELYGPVKRAWAWWRVDLVRLPSSVRYLGTFACQGGLPLALIGSASHRITHYLRAVLKHTAAYRQFVDDPIELARDQQRLLRPPTLRRDHVFRLAADVVEAVLDLESDAQSDDPLKGLDKARPDWRDTMPLDLEDERARGLLTGLLREAKRSSTEKTKNFRLERFLRDTGLGWRFGARVRLPSTIPADMLARLLRVPATTLPHRIQVNWHGNRVRPVGVYAARSEDFLLLRDQRASANEIWDADAACEIRLQFRSGGNIGEPVVPDWGGALGDLPWTFRKDSGEYPFVGEGSVSNRSPELIVLVPEDCAAQNTDAVEVTSDQVLNRVLWQVAGPIAIDTVNGRCVIRPSSGHRAEELEYRLSGERHYGIDCAWPVFRNAPTLRSAKAEQAPRAVPVNETGWRQSGGQWQQRPAPDVFGLWELRHVRSRELRYFGRAGILPPRFELALEPGTDMREGVIVLHGADAVKVAVDDTNVQGTARSDGDAVRVHVFARDQDTTPGHVRLRLHWQGEGASALVIQVPFPGHGARFLRDGRSLDADALAVGDLYGVQAIALSPDNAQRFWIEGDLKAPDSDLRDLHRVAYFRRQLSKDSVTHEMSLIELKGMTEQLLAASSSAETTVRLRIIDRTQNEYASTEVRRFAATLQHDTSMAYVSVSYATQNNSEKIFSCDALPLARPADEPVPLSIISSKDVFHGAGLPQDLNMNEPWLVVARHENRLLIRPIRVGGKSNESSGVRDADTLRLSEAISLADRELRQRSIAAAMDMILEAGETSRNEEEWSFLNDALLCASDLPANAFDLLKVLATKPRLMVRCLFEMEKSHRQLLWRFEHELPFSWLIIQRNIWWTETKRAFTRLRDQLSGVIADDRDQIARQHISSVLDEGVQFLPALSTVTTDVALRLEGRALSKPFVDSVIDQRNERTPEQIRLRASMEDWPLGYGRFEWAQELKNGEWLDRLGVWQNQKNVPRESLPYLDTPIAAAWCSVFARPSKRATFLVKRIRAHDPDWFDLAFSAAWFQLAHLADRIKQRQ